MPASPRAFPLDRSVGLFINCFVHNADAVVASPRHPAGHSRAAMYKFKPFREVVRFKQFETGAAGRQIDNSAINDAGIFSKQQNLSGPWN